MESYLEQNRDGLHFCDYSVTVIRYLESNGEAAAEDISRGCGIPLHRARLVLECLLQDGYIIGLGEDEPVYSLRNKDPGL